MEWTSLSASQEAVECSTDGIEKAYRPMKPDSKVDNSLPLAPPAMGVLRVEQKRQMLWALSEASVECQLVKKINYFLDFFLKHTFLRLPMLLKM